MFKQTLILLLAIFALSSHAYITDIEVDGPSTQIYVTTGDNHLFELDSVTVIQNYVHTTAGTTESGSLFVGKRNNQRALYDFLDTPSGGYNFVYYPVPLKPQASLSPAKSLSMPNGLSLDSTYDQKDNVAIHSVSRNLTLVNLNSMTVSDSINEWVGSRLFGRNVVYNHNNEHVYIFYTSVPVRGPYGLSAEEYSVASGKFVKVHTTYNCLCEGSYNATASPFYQVIFGDSSCSIDYSVSPAQIWCAYPGGKKLFSFNANNLTQFQVILTAAPFDSVAWDFTNKLAYAIYGHADTGAAGFEVSKVYLSNGSVVKSYTNNQLTIDTTVFKLDPTEPHLYLAIEGADELVSVDTNTLNSIQTVTLSP